MIVVVSDYAETNLESIGGWIAQSNPERALTFVRELRAACEALLPFPEAFPTLSDFPSVHRRLYGKYLIFYRIDPEEVIILAVLHGASDYVPILNDLR